MACLMMMGILGSLPPMPRKTAGNKALDIKGLLSQILSF